MFPSSSLVQRSCFCWVYFMPLPARYSPTLVQVWNSAPLSVATRTLTHTHNRTVFIRVVNFPESLRGRRGVFTLTQCDHDHTGRSTPRLRGALATQPHRYVSPLFAFSSNAPRALLFPRTEHLSFLVCSTLPTQDFSA